MDYELYHDESLVSGYWHGMLLVPARKKKEFSDLLINARNNARYFDKIGIKKVERGGHIYDCASAWTQIAVACLRSTTKGKAEPVFLGAHKNGKPQFSRVGSYGMKFILFRERDSHKELNGYADHASKIETTFRFGLKGGMHFLGSDENPINIARIHFDGHEHYRRHLDQERIVNKIDGLRSYCSFSRREDLIDDRPSNHRGRQCQDYDDCQFLQLTDILVGCFRTSLGYRTKSVHNELARPIRNLVDKYEEGCPRMKNSRWFGSFVMSQCYLENGHWEFEGIERNLAENAQANLL
jgi:hypothetical protein